MTEPFSLSQARKVKTERMREELGASRRPLVRALAVRHA